MATFLTVQQCTDREAQIKSLSDWPDDPVEYGGVRWWRVGRNASHDFYLGLDDQGQMWNTASGDGDDVLCNCDWHPRCSCERLTSEQVFFRNRRPVKDGEQLYLGR